MGWTSTVPAALAALVAALRGSPDLTGVTVLDGPTVTAAKLTEVVTVGFTDEMSPAVVEGAYVTEGLRVTPTRETYTIQCGVQVITGGTDLVAARSRAYELLAAVGQALTLNPKLDNTVMLARVSTHTLSLARTPDGFLATILFGVECDAYSGR